MYGQAPISGHVYGSEMVVRKLLATTVAFILLATGLVHAAQPYFFVSSVAAYRIVPKNLLGGSVLIPYLQIVTGLCLFLGIAERAAATWGIVLFGLFSAAQSIVLLRGDNVSCGCFGLASAQVSLASLAIPVACGAACLVLLKRTSVSAAISPQPGGNPRVADQSEFT